MKLNAHSVTLETLVALLLMLEPRWEAYQQQLDTVREKITEIREDERREIAAVITPKLTDLRLEPDAYRRAAYGRILGLFDLDTRKGIGINAAGLPDIDWVEIPAGEFIYQQGTILQLPTYQISRYHVTHKQFQVFLDADDGFYDVRWWEGLADRKERHQVQREKPVQVFPFSNHSCDGACWYDAIAFCRWWSYRLGGSYDIDRVIDWKVRLPTEQEWEKAACGTDGRRFPWGNEFVSGYANFDETDRHNFQQDQAKIRSGRVGAHFYGAPTAPGIFPQGASPYGVMDMIGTMWDLTLSDYKTGRNDDLRDYYPRVIRGGTWFVTEVYCHVQGRTMFHPHVRINGVPRINDYSFRVVMTDV